MDPMYVLTAVVKYTFVAALGVQVVLVLRALFTLARDKARPAAEPATTTEE